MNNKLQLTNHERRATSDEFSAGSALILAVVLTTLLAVIGVLFVLVARVDKIATSAISENRELNWAADSVIAKISQELVLDVPGVDPSVNVDYYDYPGPQDRWLACLEPYQFGAGDYRWRQTSDVYDRLDANALDLRAEIIDDYQPNIAEDVKADADGDGVADSVWVIIPDMTSSKGKPIYAAIRIINNGGMMNVNTTYKFDPNGPRGVIDGSSQLQINLMALANRPGRPITPPGEDELALLAERADYRFGNNIADLPKYETDLTAYEPDVIWRYGSPVGAYTPFDISDELELRYRFLVNHEDILTRIERIWTWSFNSPTELNTPIRLGGASNLTDWFYRAQHDMVGPNDIYSYKHLATTCNMDRIINPDGSRMANVNRDDAGKLYSAIYAGLSDANFGTPSAIMPIAAQLAVNIVDLRDADANVTVFSPLLPLPGGPTYYGFEAQPFISEIAFKIDGTDPVTSANNYFAVELYNPFEVPIPLVGFRLELRRPSGGVANTVNLAGYSIPANGRFVITNGGDPNLVLAKYTQTSPPPNVNYTAERYDIYLLRRTPAQDIYLDKQETQDGWFDWGTVPKDVGQFYYRHDGSWNVVYQNLDPNSIGTLGNPNGGAGKTNYNIPTFAGGFVTVGDIARVLTVGPSPSPNDMIGVRLAPQPPENSVRINLADPGSYVQQIFNYLTVFDPAVYFWNDPNETKVKGRININTAPWFVTAQLPWVSAGTPNNELAHAIVAYRDKLTLNSNVDYHTDNWGNGKTRKQGMGLKLTDPDVREDPGFASIAELLNVTQQSLLPMANEPPYDIRRYGRDNLDLFTFPDLTADGAPDDFEERDLIFSRISNLVTVRSDVFTAYILVRIGPNGPQRRVIAILDRSRVPEDKMKIIALQPVPDPR